MEISDERKNLFILHISADLLWLPIRVKKVDQTFFCFGEEKKTFFANQKLNRIVAFVFFLISKLKNTSFKKTRHLVSALRIQQTFTTVMDYEELHWW